MSNEMITVSTIKTIHADVSVGTFRSEKAGPQDLQAQMDVLAKLQRRTSRVLQARARLLDILETQNTAIAQELGITALARATADNEEVEED